MPRTVPGASTMLGMWCDAETVPALLSIRSCKVGVRAVTEVKGTGFGD